MNQKPLDATRWLKDLTKDQNLEDIDHVTRTSMSGVRRWFASRILQPMFAMGRYNPISGLIELGPEDRNGMTVLTSAVSAAATDFVITNGQTWEIYIAAGNNRTQNSYTRVDYYDGTNEYPLPSSHTSSNSTVATGGQGTYPIRITGNGTIAIRITLGTFAAGNVVRCTLVYRRVA